MVLEAQGAAHPVRRAALALATEDAWCSGLAEFVEDNKATFAVAGGTNKLDWAELHDEYQAAMEAPLEEVLGRLGLDAQDFLTQLSANTHESVRASPLPQDAIDPLRAFADYDTFEHMMRHAASEVP